MRFDVGGSWAKVTATAEEMDWIDAYAGCDVVRFVRHGGKVVREVSRYHSLDRAATRIPAGLVPLLTKASVDLVTGPPPAVTCPPRNERADLAWLRDYQRDSVLQFAETGRGIIKIGTGGGKTSCAIGCMRVFPGRWLFLSNSLSLVAQFQDAYVQFGGAPGTLTCMTLQSAHAAVKRDPDALANFDAVCLDEVHVAGADTFWAVLMAARNAKVRLGLSATPLDRGDMDALMTIGAIGPIVANVPAKVLCDAGVCGLPDITMVRCKQHGSGRTWTKVYREMVVESQARNAVVMDMVHRAAKPCLVFVDHTKHGRILADALRRSGLKVDFAHGQHKVSQRKAKVRDAVQGRVDALICTVIFQTGVDIPELESAVIACARKSVVATLQRVGRVMRMSAGKSRFEVWDVLDEGHKWLADHARQRRKAYLRELYPVRVMEVEGGG